MKIAQVAPLYESVPPRLYGGTERVVSHLTETLVDLGHEVTLFASGDSRTRANLVPVTPRALRLDGSSRDPLAHHLVMLDQVFDRSVEFDVLHYHCDYLHYPFSSRLESPSLTTLHGRLDGPDHRHLYRRFDDVPLVSVSHAQRKPLPWVNWVGTVHHGLPPAMYTATPRADGGLVFLGRISPEKRPDRAIEIAERTGASLTIAAKVDGADRDYFESRIEPLLKSPRVEFVGEVSEDDKQELLGNARALLFPIDWPEPFGLAMIEAMACGTPVIAWDCGSVPEIVDDGLTGYVVSSMDEAVDAVERAGALSRAGVRAQFEARFSAERMAKGYLDLYRKLAVGARPVERGAGSDVIA